MSHELIKLNTHVVRQMPPLRSTYFQFLQIGFYFYRMNNAPVGMAMKWCEATNESAKDAV